MAVPAEVSKLLEDLRSEKEEIRKKAVISLGRYNLPEVRDALSQLSNDNSTAVRYFVKKALKDFETSGASQATMTGGFDLTSSAPPRPAAPPPAPQAAPVPPKPVEKTMVSASDIMDRSGGSLTQILNDLKSPDENAKIEAIKKLGERKEVVATEPLLGLIHHQDRNIRLYAVQSLGYIGENRVLTPLLNLLNTEQDAYVVATLVKAIARVGGVQLIPIIARYLKDPDARTRANTIEALEIIADPKIIKFLIPLLQDPNSRVKANTIKVLSKFGKSNMLEKLEEMLQSEDVSIRGSSIYALNAIGGDQVVEILEKAKNDTDPENVMRVIEALAKVATPKAMELISTLTRHRDAEVAKMAEKYLSGAPVESAKSQPEPSKETLQIPQEPQFQPSQPTPKVPAEQPKTPPPQQPQPVRAAQPAQPVETAKPQAVYASDQSRPRDFNRQEFEKLWNDVVSTIGDFKKRHPNFDSEKVSTFLDLIRDALV